MHRLSKQHGFSLIELIVAITIGMIAIFGVIVMMKGFFQTKSSQDAEIAGVGIMKAELLRVQNGFTERLRTAVAGFAATDGMRIAGFYDFTLRSRVAQPAGTERVVEYHYTTVCSPLPAGQIDNSVLRQVIPNFCTNLQGPAGCGAGNRYEVRLESKYYDAAGSEVVAMAKTWAFPGSLGGENEPLAAAICVTPNTDPPAVGSDITVQMAVAVFSRNNFIKWNKQQLLLTAQNKGFELTR